MVCVGGDRKGGGLVTVVFEKALALVCASESPQKKQKKSARCSLYYVW